MERYKLGEKEQRFADLIWEHAPIATGELVTLCEEAFDWKRTTTYTMLKRLCVRQMFVNEDGMVKALMTREEFLTAQGQQFLDAAFGGSLPRFVAAFTRRRRLSGSEIEELRRLINDYGEGEDDD